MRGREPARALEADAPGGAGDDRDGPRHRQQRRLSRRRARYAWFSARSPNTSAIDSASRPVTSAGKITKKTTTSPSVAENELRAMTITRRNANTRRGHRWPTRRNCTICAERHVLRAQGEGG